MGPEVLELARAAVRRIADAAPTADAARDARHALEVFERVGSGPPYTVAIAGDATARTALLNYLAGQPLFDRARRDPDRIILTLRRGPATALRARRRDGSLVELGGAPPPRTAPRRASPPDPPPRPASPSLARTAGVAPVERDTTMQVRHPPWWAVWRWLMLWFRGWWSRSRGLLPAPAAAIERSKAAAAAPSPASPDGPAAPGQRGIARTIERARPIALKQLAGALCTWFADPAIERVFVEVDGGHLPDKVVVIELPSPADARSLESVAADACLVACSGDGFTMTQQLDTVLTIVPHLFVVGATAIAPGASPEVRLLGGFDAVAPALVKLAATERALAVGRRAMAVLNPVCEAIDRRITDAEVEFRTRLARLEVLQIASPEDHTATALAFVRQAVVERAHYLIRRALAKLDDDIARFAAGWSARLRDAPSTDALRDAAAQLDDESPAALQAAQTAAFTTLVDELNEHAHAHYHELVSTLRQGSTRSDALPSWFAVEVKIGEMTSGTKLGTVAPRLTSLFRSLDALKADAIAQLEQRIGKLRQVASANVRDAEPKLEPAVTGTIAIALRAEVERHAAWLAAELARERAAIEAERAELATLAAVLDAARDDRSELAVQIEALGFELP